MCNNLNAVILSSHQHAMEIKTPHTLKNPPVKEAITQIKVTPKTKFNKSFFESYAQLEKEKYPTSAPQQETLFQFISGEHGAHSGVTNKGISGYKLSSKDGQNIIQIAKDRFAVSRLEPYRTWDDLIQETHRTWVNYISIFEPSSVIGLSVRYINHFLIPSSMQKFEDYLECTPVIPKGLPQSFASFYVNYRLPNPETNAVANVQLIFEGAIETEDKSGMIIPIVLDSDVYKICTLDPSSDDIWNAFNELHDFKNTVFFQSLTYKTLEMFQ